MGINLKTVAEDAINEANNEQFNEEDNFIPLSSDPKDVWDEWYSKAWTKDRAREEFLKNRNMSNLEFTKLLGHLYKPGDLGGKAIAFKSGQHTLTDDDRGFFENWLMSKSNNLIEIIEELMDSEDVK